MFFLPSYKNSLISRSHLHSEGEDAAQAQSPGLDVDLALARLNDLLDNHQAESDTFTVHRGGTLQFAKASEQFVHVLSGDPDS